MKANFNQICHNASLCEGNSNAQPGDKFSKVVFTREMLLICIACQKRPLTYHPIQRRALCCNAIGLNQVSSTNRGTFTLFKP